MSFRILQYSDLEAAYDDPERIGRVAGLIAARRTENTVLFGTGDDVGPGVLALVTDGRGALDFFSEARPDADTFGNHDFDYGADSLLGVVRDSPHQWLCANAYRDDDREDRFGASAGVRPWTVLERGGHRLGVVGLANPDTDALSPGAAGLSFADPIDAAHDALGALDTRDVDCTVCLSHLGTDALARETDADVVLDGHAHDRPRIARIDGTLLVRTSGLGRDLAELTFDPGSDDGTWHARRHAVSDAPRCAAVVERFRDSWARAGLDEVVGAVEEPIARSKEAKYEGESRLGNFVADAYRWIAGADVGLQNAPGLREGPPLAGRVTVADLAGIVPFDVRVALAAVSGDTLLEILEQGAALLFPEEPTWWYAHLSGAAVTFEYTGRRVTAATVGGEPVASDDTYTVAAPDYVLRSTREFPALTSTHRRETFCRQYEALARFARTEGIDPRLEDRITRRAVER